MNRLLRKVFLWFARNEWLREHLPTMPFMQRAVRRFMPGDAIDDALGVAVELEAWGSGRCTRSSARTSPRRPRPRRSPTTTSSCCARIKEAEIDGEISVKPTQLGLDIDEDLCLGHLRTLAAAAEAQGSYLWIDMEDSAYVDRTLDLYQRLRSTHARTGICLQAYLRRTAKDVERAAPAGSRDPPREGRVRRARGDRLPVEEGGRRQLPRRSRSRSSARAGTGPCGSASAPTTSS